MDMNEMVKNDMARQKILRQLTAIDTQTIRPLRAVNSGNATADDETRLREFDAQAAALRAELAALLKI